MLVRSPRRFLVLVPALAAALASAKVVKTEKDESPANGAQQCTCTTRKVKKVQGPRAEVEAPGDRAAHHRGAALEASEHPLDDGSRFQGLGDEAYVTKFSQVIAVSGDIVLAAKPQNYSGASTKIRGIGEGAVRAALPRLGQVTVSPPSASGS